MVFPRPKEVVIPAQAGIHGREKKMDARFRGHDN
jgi:hypothetical protein